MPLECAGLTALSAEGQSGVEPPQSKAFGPGGCHGAAPTSC